MLLVRMMEALWCNDRCLAAQSDISVAGSVLIGQSDFGRGPHLGYFGNFGEQSMVEFRLIRPRCARVGVDGPRVCPSIL